jgi:tetratricopeptide (TPR) repeat protein
LQSHGKAAAIWRDGAENNALSRAGARLFATCTLVVMAIAWWAIVHATALESSAHAQNAHARAVALLDQSAEQYREGHFAEAADLLREAYEIEPAPVLLYNLARALEGLGDLPGAVEAYEGYIEGDPDADDRGAIEARLETLRRQMEALDRVEDPPDDPEPPPDPIAEPDPPLEEEEPPSGASPIPWTIAGVGGAGVIAGVVLGVLAQLRHDDAIAAPIQTERVALAGEADDLAFGANLAFAIGGGLLLVGIVWGVLDLVLE